MELFIDTIKKIQYFLCKSITIWETTIKVSLQMNLTINYNVSPLNCIKHYPPNSEVLRCFIDSMYAIWYSYCWQIIIKCKSTKNYGVWVFFLYKLCKFAFFLVCRNSIWLRCLCPTQSVAIFLECHWNSLWVQIYLKTRP